MGRRRRPIDYSYLKIILSLWHATVSNGAGLAGKSPPVYRGRHGPLPPYALTRYAGLRDALNAELTPHASHDKLGAWPGVSLQAVSEHSAVFTDGHRPQIGVGTGNQSGRISVCQKCL